MQFLGCIFYCGVEVVICNLIKCVVCECGEVSKIHINNVY
jgi:hypothetical protein